MPRDFTPFVNDQMWMRNLKFSSGGFKNSFSSFDGFKQKPISPYADFQKTLSIPPRFFRRARFNPSFGVLGQSFVVVSNTRTYLKVPCPTPNCAQIPNLLDQKRMGFRNRELRGQMCDLGRRAELGIPVESNRTEPIFAIALKFRPKTPKPWLGSHQIAQLAFFRKSKVKKLTFLKPVICDFQNKTKINSTAIFESDQ